MITKKLNFIAVKSVDYMFFPLWCIGFVFTLLQAILAIRANTRYRIWGLLAGLCLCLAETAAIA